MPTEQELFLQTTWRRRRIGGLLFRYSPGTGGGTFTRSTTGTYTDQNGVVQTAAINTLRDGHYVGGVRTTLLEGLSTNLCLQSGSIGAAPWASSGGTVVANQATAPDGTLTASQLTLTTTNTSGGSEQSITVGGGTASKSFTVSVWVKVAAGTAPFQLKNTQGGVIDNFSGALTATTTWQRFTLTVTNGATAGTGAQTLGIVSTGSASVLLVWGAQLEQAPFASSYIPTTTAAVTRGADLLTDPVSIGRGDKTILVKYVTLGSFSVNLGQRLVQLSTTVGGQGLLFKQDLNSIDMQYIDGSTNPTSVVATNASIGDTIEARLTFSNNQIQVSRSINGGVESLGSVSAAIADSAPYNALTINSNSDGSSTGFGAYQFVKIASGVRSLAEMRNL